MSRYDNPWAKHYQSHWQEKAAVHGLPLWARVAFLAYGTHKANGHARFKPGHVALMLGRVDPDTGEITTPDKHNIQRAIRTAVANGWLVKGSSSLCLVVPAHCIEGGLGNEHEECPIHLKARKRVRHAHTA